MVKRRVRFALWWRKSGMWLRFPVIVAGFLAFFFLMYWLRSDDEMARSGGGLLAFGLVHLNIAILCVLAFLIGRNIVKLIFDRRKGILGSHLRSRLVFAFVGLTLIPTIILFVLASGLLNRSIQGWFSSQVEASVTGAVEVARHHYNWVKDFVSEFSRRIASDIENRPELQKSNPALRAYLDGQRRDWKLFSLSLKRADGSQAVGVQNATANIDSFSEPSADKEAFGKALKGEETVLFESKDASQFVRAYMPVRLDEKPYVLLVTMRINPELSQSLSAVNASFREYEQLKLLKRPIKSGYILTLSMITGLLLFSAIWIAFYMAKEIAVPIQRLAEATRFVARGRYDIQIREKGEDEMGILVKSFNQMTNEIRNSREESERRRIYIETILANLAVGVIGVDSARKVSSINAAAARIFGFSDIQAVAGREIGEVLPIDGYEQVKPLLEEVEEADSRGQMAPTISERQMAISSLGRELKILVTAGQIRDEKGKVLGSVLLFDDITELSKGQQMAAWREVAQRIAHEIKNPLTPIQLSAQRISRVVAEAQISPEDAKGRLADCSQTIVEHVDSIKRLANEFSHFARMPHSEFSPIALNTLLSDTLAPYAEENSDIVFQFIADNQMPEVEMDKEQIRRAFINLLDNSIVALRNDTQRVNDGPRITVKTLYDKRRRIATIEVGDNGPGIQKQDKTRVFEPYFTTKKGGTGLGLAIVTSVVADHQGVIRVYDNDPRGAKFVIDLPISHNKPTQRRFAFM